MTTCTWHSSFPAVMLLLSLSKKYLHPAGEPVVSESFLLRFTLYSCHAATSCIGGTKNGHNSNLQKKMADLHKNCQLLVSQIASIQSMTSDPTKLDPKVRLTT